MYKLQSCYKEYMEQHILYKFSLIFCTLVIAVNFMSKIHTHSQSASASGAAICELLLGGL